MLTQTRRETKYTHSIRLIMANLGHATNAEITSTLRREFPDVSDTTVHRVTTRLHEDGELGLAPNAPDGSVRYDSNLSEHDHFACSMCGELRDLVVPARYRQMIQNELGDCQVRGGLVISGGCHDCIK